ncbi:MAG: hypothetical protein ACT4OJ_01875 [Bacteroidota bacterium]
MKRILFHTLVCFAASLAGAQSYDPIKTMLTLGQYQKAKEELDKNMGNAKFISKAEAYMLKTAIYAALSMDNANKATPAGEQLATDAEAAFKKYKEMDQAMSLISDPIYQNGPINLYSFFYSSGYGDYSKKSWQKGFDKLKKAVEMSDLLISKKIITAPLDTNVLVLAGVTAAESKNDDAAALYYGRLADARIPGAEFESIYRFLVNYYFGKKNMTAFEKYKALGQELFPKSDYFTYDKVDFAVGLVESFAEKVKAVEEVLATDPDNYKANQVLGEIIYDTLNPKEGDPMPSNAAELEPKMVNAFLKSAAAKPGSELPYLFLGDHFISKAVKVNEARTAHAADMKTRTKPGQPNSKEDVAKRDLLDKQYGEALEAARDPYEKAAAIFAGKTNMTLRDKQQYKKAANYLADIFAFKKIQAKGKPADQAKYAAEEKKWNDTYDTIK